MWPPSHLKQFFTANQRGLLFCISFEPPAYPDLFCARKFRLDGCQKRQPKLDEMGHNMKYHKDITLKDGRACLLRSAAGADAEAVLATLNKVHAETDFLLSYPDEKRFSAEEEADFLAGKEISPSEAELCSIVENKIRGLAGVFSVGAREKVRHRAELGISIEKEFWGLGIGRALTEACIECAKNAGYRQLELEAVAENSSAIALYKSLGFREYGRNPRGFLSRYAGWQELVLMRLPLD